MTDLATTSPAPDLPAPAARTAAAPTPDVPVSRASRRSAAVRALEPGDIPSVCDLFLATFGPGRACGRDAVERRLAAIYLTGPGDRFGPASQVYLGADGRVGGFMGVLTLAARYRDGRRLRCGILGSFMGREADRARAGVALSRATFALGFEVMFSDTASRGSVDLSRSFGFDVLPAHSLGWTKVIRPCATGAALVARSRPRLGVPLRAAARGLDRIACRLPHLAVPPEDAAGSDVRPVVPDDLPAVAGRHLLRYDLRPAWDERELAWLLDGVGRAGEGTLLAREVVDRRGRAAGLFLLLLRPGGTARVLQLLADRGREPAVVAAAIREAARLGAAAVEGRTSPTASAGLLWQRGVLYRRAPAAIGLARDPEIHAALLSDRACLGGLFGEAWTLPDAS